MRRDVEMRSALEMGRREEIRRAYDNAERGGGGGGGGGGGDEEEGSK